MGWGTSGTRHFYGSVRCHANFVCGSYAVYEATYRAGGGQVSRSKNTVLVTRIVPLEIVMLGSGRQERSVRWAESSA